MPVKQFKGAKKKCDDLYSLIIRSKGSCERCGVTCECPAAPKAHNRLCKLTTSHIVGRRFSATRTWIPNSQSLCYSCHRRFTDWPREFSHWITESIGSDAYDALRLRAETVTKIDWTQEYERLKEIARDKGILT